MRIWLILLDDLGKQEEAEPLYRRVLEILKASVPDHPSTATCRDNLTGLLDRMQSKKD